MSEFFQEVYAIVEKIPYGKVISYGQIAEALGRPRSARIVGFAMNRCPDDLPWHRVVRTDGSIASEVMADLSLDLLRQEGVFFRTDGRVDMDKSRWKIPDE